MTYTDSFSIRYITSLGETALNGFDIASGLTFRYLGDQGFGLAPMHRITTRGPLQNGDSDIDFRLDPRILQVPLIVKNESVADARFTHYEIRSKLLSIFRPQTPGMLRLITSNSASSATLRYSIDVKVLGGLTFDVDPADLHVRTVVQLRADDPTWYRGTVPGNRIIFNYPDTSIGSSEVISAVGTWQSFPIIRINGPITNPTITNSTTGQSIAMTATITAGSWYEIDLEYGKKTVVDSGGVNRISTVSASSNLATWALVPGNNTIAVTGTGTTSASDLTFSYYDRYTGI